MTQEDPLQLVSSDPTANDSREPWREHGPVALESIPLTDMDDTNKTFQFRIPTDRKRLWRESQEPGADQSDQSRRR